MNILFLTPRLPFPPVGGDRVRAFQFIKHLGRSHRVTVVSFVEHPDEARAAEPYRDLFHRLVTVPLLRRRSYLNALVGLASSQPLQVCYYRSPDMRAALAREFAGNSYDVCFCFMIRVAQYLDQVPVRKVVDFCDAQAIFHRRSAALAHGLRRSTLIHAVEAKRIGPYEIGWVNRADVAIFISTVDAEYCRRPENADRIAIVRNGVDTNAFPFHPGPRDENRIVYMGNMRTFQNTDAVTYFVEEIFPLVRKQRPHAVLHIVGNAPSKDVQRLHDGKGVIVTGRVDSVIQYMAAASVMVAPMRAVAGVQNKILESLAVGTPVVTTSIGAEGLDPRVMTIADTPPAFADATVALMTDPARRNEIAAAGRACIETQYTWEKTLAGLDSLLEGRISDRNRIPTGSNPKAEKTPV
ncbi:MAG TPA: glycosyltransferase [Candidatus Krumholzibacteria bacterium]